MKFWSQAKWFLNKSNKLQLKTTFFVDHFKRGVHKDHLIDNEIETQTLFSMAKTYFDGSFAF